MPVVKRIRDSKDQFFGGGKGGLIRFGPNTPKGFKPKSKSEEPDSQSPDMTEYHEQLRQEIREQFGVSPTEEPLKGKLPISNPPEEDE